MGSENVKELSSYVRGKIARLSDGSPASRASQARIRKAVGKEPGSDPELWTEILGGLPEGLSGRGDEPSYGEWAAHVALTLWAVHEQSGDASAYDHGVGFGSACGKFAGRYGGDSDKSNPRHKRAASVVRSSDIRDLAQRARGLVVLLGGDGIGFDYGRFAEDLYWFQHDAARQKVLLSWGRGYAASSHAAAGED